MADLMQKLRAGGASPQKPQGNLRPDGTAKGPGFLGTIKLPDGGHATEYSIGVPIFGKETDIPTLVPTLTKEEIELMRNDIIPNRGKLPESILRKVVDHAKERVRAGKSPFYDPSEGK